MSRRSNAVRALESAARVERKAWDALLATAPRTRDDVASAPVKGDSFTGHGGLTWTVTATRPGYIWSTSDDNPGGTMHDVEQCDIMPTWARMVRAAPSVYPVYPPARIARRAVWERAAARLETARRTLEALPPAGHKRRKDGTTYPVASPRQNAAAKAGREAWNRAMGRSLAFMGVALAFVVLLLSACN